LNGQDCERCRSCSGGRVRIGCGGTSAGSCQTGACLKLETRVCPTGSTRACLFEKTQTTSRTSGSSTTDTGSWSVSAQVVGAPQAMQDYADEITLTGTAEVGGSRSVTRFQSVVERTTGTEYVILGPGQAYCYYFEIERFADGGPSCGMPHIYEGALPSDGQVTSVCGDSVRDAEVCPQDVRCTTGDTGTEPSDVSGGTLSSLDSWALCSVMLVSLMVWGS
jgi:hypothetical protein